MANAHAIRPDSGFQFVAIADPSVAPGGFQRLGYGFLIVYLFLIYSRIFDVKLSSLHIPGISFRIIFVTILASQAFLVALRSNIGRAALFLFAWYVCSIPTSVWRRGSIQALYEAEIPAFVVFLATAGLIGNYQQLRKALSTLAFAFLVLTLIAVVWGSTEETGRLYLPQGKFSNPNEMAQALLLGMPLWWLVLRNSSSFFKRLFAIGVMALMLRMISKTGSRGALIAMAVVLLFAFLRASLAGRLKLVSVTCFLFGAAILTMPSRLMQRYSTLTQSQDELALTGDPDADATVVTAVSSAEARKYLLKESIKLTIRHPLFGVGPDMFPVAEDADARAQGKRKGAWQGTHNSYTQVSSEIGIPGAIAYVLIIFLSLRTSSRLYHRTRGDIRLRDIADSALCLNCCIIVYAVTVMFDYIAFTSMLSVFSGLVATISRVAEAEIERRMTAPAGPLRIPLAQFRPVWRKNAGVPAESCSC